MPQPILRTHKKPSMKNVVLFGGSFNPPHIGHFEMAKHITQTLDIHEVWFLFSHNIDKDPAIYAPLEHRIAMSNILNQDYSDCPFIMSDAEYKTGTHLTADVLPKIETAHPDHKFIWAMGADNLEHFHLWEGYERIIENYPMILFNRSSYQDDQCPAFVNYESYMCRDPKRLLKQKSGVHFLDNPYIDVSSTAIRKNIKSGLMIDHDDLSAYIKEHHLYR